MDKFSQNNDKKNPFTITLCSGKGGVGTSFLTANLASAVSKLGNKVLILDSVLDLPNQHILFGVEPPVRLSSVLSGKVNVDSALYKIDYNISLLVDSPIEIDDDNDHILSLKEVVNQLKSECEKEFLFIDVQSGISEELIALSKLSDLVLIVITDEPTSLIDAYGLLKILRNYVDISKIALIVNNVIDDEDAGELSHKFNLASTQFLGLKIDVLGFVPYSRNVRYSIQRQEILVNNFEDDEASSAILNISKKIHSKYFVSSYNTKMIEVL
ncbi:MinD/ParA family protein [Candidatus Kapaibacterium sp.]